MCSFILSLFSCELDGDSHGIRTMKRVWDCQNIYLVPFHYAFRYVQQLGFLDVYRQCEISWSNSIFYKHHLENHTSVTVTPKLDATSMNYMSWRHSFILAISIHNKQGFLDGSIPKSAAEGVELKAWKQCNNLIVVQLLRSMTPSIESTVFYIKVPRR